MITGRTAPATHAGGSRRSSSGRQDASTACLSPKLCDRADKDPPQPLRASTDCCTLIMRRQSAGFASRRQALLLVTAGAAAAFQADDALARYGNWDNESAAVGSCAIGDDGDECRRALLL